MSVQMLLGEGRDVVEFRKELTQKTNLALLFGIAVLIVVNPLTFGNAIGALGFIVAALMISYLLNALGISSFVSLLGRVSYFLYFSHFAVLYVCAHVVWEFSRFATWLPPIGYQAFLTILFAILSICLSVPLALLSWRYIERPIISLVGNKFGKSASSAT